MSATVTIEEAQARLAELVSKRAPGQEIVLMENDQPVATLTGQYTRAHQLRQPGSAKGQFIIVADDDELAALKLKSQPPSQPCTQRVSVARR